MTKNIAFFTVSTDDWSVEIYPVPDNNPLVAFAERWAAVGKAGKAYLDPDDPSDVRLIKAMFKIMQHGKPLPYPCTVDHVVSYLNT